MAIEALHGKYAMKAGELPLVVRYADPPKSQRGGNTAAGAYGGRGAFPPGWPASPPAWPSGPPPMGWPMHPYAMPGGGMPGYPPWAMPPMAGQPGVPGPYGYYGQQYGAQGGSPPSSQAPGGVPPPPQYGGAPPPPPPHLGGGNPHAPPLPPPAPPSSMGAWTEHHTPEGLRYYYNTQTGTSSWEMPPEMQVKQQRQSHHPGQQAHHQPVPPLPPLPHNAGGQGQGAGLDKAMEALSMGGSGGYAPQSSNPLGAAGAYLPHGHVGNGLGSIGGIPTLGLGLPQNGGHDGGGEGVGAEAQWWAGGDQAVNVQ